MRVFSKIYVILVGLILSAFITSAFAHNLNLSLNLKSIKAITLSEEKGDELYFDITEYSSLERPKHYQVPNFPLHWMSKSLESISNVSFWKKKLKDEESVVILISLVERDAPPWNVDDLIGSVKVKIKNDGGRIDQAWSVPNKKVAGQIKGNTFALTGNDAEYHVAFDITVEQDLEEKP